MVDWKLERKLLKRCLFINCLKQLIIVEEVSESQMKWNDNTENLFLITPRFNYVKQSSSISFIEFLNNIILRRDAAYASFQLSI